MDPFTGCNGSALQPPLHLNLLHSNGDALDHVAMSQEHGDPICKPSFGIVVSAPAFSVLGYTQSLRTREKIP